MSCPSPFLQHHGMRSVAVLALAIGLSTGVAAAQQVVTQPRPGMPQTQTGPRDPTAPRDTGTGRVSGRVVGGDTGAPLRRAMVSLGGEGLQEGRATTTDEHGRYEFKDLPPGRFSVQANKAGYVSLGYGQRRPMQGGRSIELAEGEALDRIDFNLPRGGVIAGRIVDEFGEPVAGLQVQAMRYVFREGRRQLAPVGGFGLQTDDRGQYRIYGLPAGEYYVSAQVQQGMFGAQSDSRSGMGTTYYPGALNVAEAQRVPVSPATEQTSINFAVLPTRTVKVSGTVTNSQGRPLRQGMIMVQLGRDTAFFTLSGGGMIKPDGSFTIGNLSPGEYTFHVSTAMNPEDDEAESAIVPMSVGMDDMTGVVITTARATPISGQLVFETAAAGSLKPAEFSLFARAADPQSMMFGRMAVAKDDWTFELRAMEGPVLIRPARFPEGWTVKAVMVNGVDAVDTGIPLRPGQPIEGVQVIVSNRSSAILGSVADAAGTPVKDYTVVIFPNDADRWTPVSRFLATARPDQQGRFESSNLPAGDYLVVAVDSIEEGQQSDPEFLQQMRAYATPLQLNDGEKRPVNLRLVALR